MNPRALALFIGLALAPLSLLPAQEDRSAMLAGFVAAGELDDIHTRIRTKMEAGTHTAEAFAPEIAKLDECIALFADDKDMAVQFAFTKAMLFTDVIKNLDKGRELLRAVKRDYPDSDYAKKVDELIVALEKAAKRDVANAELIPLLEKIKAKARDGAKTADAFAPEIAQFDKLIAKYSRTNPEAAASVAFQKAGLYFDAIKDFPKAREVLVALQKKFPDTTSAKPAQEGITYIDSLTPPQPAAAPDKKKK